MADSIQSVIEIVAELCQERNLVVSISESAKGGLIAGTTTALGGIALGPVGLLLGAIIGGVAAYSGSAGKFKPVAVVLKEMPQARKAKLLQMIKKAVSDIHPNDVLSLAALLLHNQNIQDIALKEVGNFLSKEMNLKILH